MKKPLILSIFFLTVLMTVSCNSGNKAGMIGRPNTELLTFGGPGTDVGNYIIEVNGGGYAIAGYFSSPNGNGYQGVIIRLDAKGETIWSKTYGANGDNRAWSLAEAADGSFLVAGFSNGPGSHGASDVWLFKVDRNGQLLWEKMLGGSKDDMAWEIIKTSDGNYAVAGQTESLGGGGIDAWLIKLDDKGNILWDQSYGTAGTERVFGITEDPDGNLVASGLYIEHEGADSDIYTLSVNSTTGRTNWKDILDKGKDDIGHGITIDQNGKVWIAGYTNSLGAGEHDGFIAKYDGRESVAFHTFGGVQNDRIMNIRFNRQNQLFFTGYSNSGDKGRKWDIWTGQISTSGESIDDSYYGGNNDDRGVHLLINENQLITVGSMGSTKNDTNLDLAIVSFDLSKDQ